MSKPFTNKCMNHTHTIAQRLTDIPLYNLISTIKWKCESCGSLHDRDINAGVNIMFEGLKRYMKERYA